MEVKDKLEKYWMPLGTVLLSTAITVVGNYYNDRLRTALMEERLATMQTRLAEHELEKSKQIQRTAERADDHEQRIVRLEANFGMIQSTLEEMRGDIKLLIRGKGN